MSRKRYFHIHSSKEYVYDNKKAIHNHNLLICHNQIAVVFNIQNSEWHYNVIFFVLGPNNFYRINTCVLLLRRLRAKVEELNREVAMMNEREEAIKQREQDLADVSFYKGHIVDMVSSKPLKTENQLCGLNFMIECVCLV